MPNQNDAVDYGPGHLSLVAPPYSRRALAAHGKERIEITEEFKQALRLIEESEENVFITGRAGTGKSTLLRHFIATTQRHAVIVAPTGIAALQINGQTIHSFFQFPSRVIEPNDIKHLYPPKRRLMERLNVLVIDEISMVRADVLDAMDASLRLNRNRPHLPFGGVRVVFFGDLLQLPPVVNEDLHLYFSHAYETPYFYSSRVFKDLNYHRIELTKNYRQGNDPQFFDLLSRLGRNQITEADLTALNRRLLANRMPQHKKLITLTATNAAASAINQERLSKLPGDPAEYQATITDEFDEESFPTDQILKLKPGAQVMLIRNDEYKQWVNGDMGIIERCYKNKLSVRIRGQLCEVRPTLWEKYQYFYNTQEKRIKQNAIGAFEQLPIRLAWAITIHKSQGQTLKSVIVDIGHGAFAHGQVYVALSRCQSLDDLWLSRPLSRQDIVFDERVLAFEARS